MPFLARHVFISQACCTALMLILFTTVFQVHGSLAGPTPQPSETVRTAGVAYRWLSDTWQFVKGEPADSAIYMGMWSRHFINNKDDYRTNHELVGACYNGYFFGTFKNSHSDRGGGAGFQRDVYRGQVRDAAWRFGYRAGIVYGYEELSLFDTKLFPFVQPYADLSYKQGGVELSWAGSTVLIGFFWRI